MIFFKNVAILSSLLKNTFNYTMIYSDKHYRPAIETKAEHEELLKKIEKIPISFDLNLFYNHYDPSKNKLGANDLLQYIYEMGTNMKMISLRQIEESSLLDSSKKNKALNTLKLEKGFILMKNVIFIIL